MKYCQECGYDCRGRDICPECGFDINDPDGSETIDYDRDPFGFPDEDYPSYWDDEDLTDDIFHKLYQ